jgi:mRNA interferase MazF
VVVLAKAGLRDWVLGQVTSNPDVDTLAIELTNESLDQGYLRLVSYFRPNKLFTGNEALILKPIATLKTEIFNRLLDATMDILDRNRMRQ